MSEHYTEIVRWAEDDHDDEVIERMGPYPQRVAEKVARGAEINLNHDSYFVRVVPS